MEKRKRPVEFTTIKTTHVQKDGYTQPEREEIKTQGLFHQWGVEAEEHETNYGNYTVGVIEDENGQMHTILPNNIKFLDR